MYIIITENINIMRNVMQTSSRTCKPTVLSKNQKNQSESYLNRNYQTPTP